MIHKRQIAGGKLQREFHPILTHYDERLICVSDCFLDLVPALKLENYSRDV